MLRSLLLLTALLATLTKLEAQSAGSSSSTSGAVVHTAAPLALPADLQAELDALQSDAWHPSATIRGSLGWRDNVLLSPFAPLERPFARAELEALLLRPMRDSWEFISFLNGDVLRYLSPPAETGGEQQWSLHAETRWQPVDAARLALKGAGYLRDMVVDLSETEARRVVAPTRVRGGYVALAPRLTLPGKFRFEPSVQVKRTDYRDYPGDYDEVRSGGRLEWRGAGLTLSAAWFEARRRYDERGEYTAGGRPLPDTRLRFRQRDGELKARTSWKAAGDWSAAATVGKLENRDRASGYFDYDQKRARLELTWERAAWLVTFDGEAKRLDYLVQTVGAGIAPPPRIADDYEVTLRTQRALGERWAAFAEHRWERSRSNELDFRYKANTVLAGIQREF